MIPNNVDNRYVIICPFPRRLSHIFLRIMMDEDCLELSKATDDLFSSSCLTLMKTQGIVGGFVTNSGPSKFQKKVKTLLSSRRLPEEGWSEEEICALLQQLSQMDTSYYSVGVGEREGRVFCPLVRRRCFGLSHGMGRSGNLGGAQPKAAGSSLLVSLTNFFALQMLREAGDPEVEDASVFPVCTGMSLFLCLAALRKERPAAKHVLWMRCDQQSAVKAVHLCGLNLVVIEGILKGDAIVTNEAELVAQMDALGADSICSVLSTTSCFAPRECDDLEAVARLCKERNVPHLVNNAYGVQSRELMKAIARARRVGRLDGYVQSTDKNWCVPVGGGVIAGRIAKLANAEYSGRASSSPLVDMFITCLAMGISGWKKLLQDREALFKSAREEFSKLEEFRLLSTDKNPISLALAFSSPALDPIMLGSFLFKRGITGHRVCVRTQKVSNPDGSQEFVNWGQHMKVYEPCVSYITFAITVGATPDEVQTALKVLRKTMKEFRKMEAKTMK